MNKKEYLEFLDESTKIREQAGKAEYPVRPEGWLEGREYTNPEEVVDDILYITDKCKDKALSDTELDAYYYKRRWMQDKLGELYADKYVLVNEFNKIQFICTYNPNAENVITELAHHLNCYVLLKKDGEYFAELGDDVVRMGKYPDVSKLEITK